ncbi:MAG: hypothetical protein ACE5K4_08700 [Candidatus Hydrothermarchaeota archaeon]
MRLFNPLKRLFNNNDKGSENIDHWVKEVWNAYTVVQRRFALGEISEEDYNESLEKIYSELEKIEKIVNKKY